MDDVDNFRYVFVISTRYAWLRDSDKPVNYLPDLPIEITALQCSL